MTMPLYDKNLFAEKTKMSLDVASIQICSSLESKR